MIPVIKVNVKPDRAVGRDFFITSALEQRENFLANSEVIEIEDGYFTDDTELSAIKAEAVKEYHELLMSYSRAYESKGPTGQIMRSYVDCGDMQDAFKKILGGGGE